MPLTPLRIFNQRASFDFLSPSFAVTRETKHPSTSFFLYSLLQENQGDTRRVSKPRHAFFLFKFWKSSQGSTDPPSTFLVFFLAVFISEKSWLEQGWLVALVMMSMLPFMGIGAAPWMREIVGGFSILLAIFVFFLRFLLLLGEFSFCLLVGSF